MAIAEAYKRPVELYNEYCVHIKTFEKESLLIEDLNPLRF